MERLLKIKGFSLIELIVVFIIVVILATTVYLKWSSSSIRLNSQAALLADDIRYTQNLAMTQHQRFRLAITPPNTYQIQDESNNPISISTRGTTITLGASITFGNITGITSKIIFNSKGIPYNDATPNIPITDNVVIRLTSEGETVAITIQPETGRVTP